MKLPPMDDLLLQPSRPQRADAQKNYTLLLETARTLFDEQGVDAVSMSAIADAAGVGKGTLYRHFSNKQDLCQALLDQTQRDLQARALERLRSQTDPLTNLRWFVREVAIFVDQNAAFLCTGTGTEQLMLTHPAHLWWRQTIHGLLTQINPPGDIEYSADTLYAMLDVHTIYFQRETLSYTRDRLLNGLDRLIDRLIS